MSTNVIGCTVYIDGAPISDGCSALSPDAPAVLSGLRVVWGRAGSVDQATASTCTFAVDDPLTGGDRLVPALTIGRRIDVHADTVVYPDPSVSTIPVLLPGPTSNVKAVGGSGTTSNTIIGGSLYRAAVVTYPPRAYSNDPTAWDAVPRTLPGQPWQLNATLSFPAEFAGWRAYAATIRPVAFTSPAGPGTLLPDNAALSPAGGSVALSFTPPAGVWLGLQVSIHPAGPRWDDLDGTSWTAAPATSWDGLSRFVLSAVAMLAPPAGAATSGLVFSGRITDVAAEWNGGNSATVSVIAQDWLAELANRYVGDAPWLKEALSTRAQRIITQSGQPVKLTVDSRIGALQVTYRDVDRQPAANLLQQLAQSGAGILWTATHLVTGQTMWIEDTGNRPAASTLTDASGLVRVTMSQSAIAHSLPISACDIEADPVRFGLDMSDTVSTVALTWKDQTLNTQGQPAPTDTLVTVTDAEVEKVIGARRLSVSTQLAVLADAQAQANLWLARSSTLGWRIEGLVWDTSLEPGLSPDDTDTVMTLLDGMRRIGLPIALTEMPPWTWPLTGGQGSVALYIEGGSYTYEAGSWVLELNTSSATGSAVGNLPWQNLPAPAAVATNLFTRPSFEDGTTTGWALSNAVLSVPTASNPAIPGRSGTKVMRATITTTGTILNMWTSATTLQPDVQAGKRYRYAAYSRAQSSASSAQIVAEYRDSGGVTIAGTQVVAPAVQHPSSQGWIRAELTMGVAPANAVKLFMYLRAPGAGVTAGQWIDFDAITVHEIAAAGDVTLPYFDGDTPAAGADVYAWTGTRWASTSTRTTNPVPEAWAWDEFAPDVSWLDLFGVTYPDV